MTTAVRSFILAFALVAVSLLGIAFTHDQSGPPLPAPTVTANAPTIITTAPCTISAPGYYQLGANLIYAGTGKTNDAIITIHASNVTLDFAGHYLSGPTANAATQLRGIYANERSNVLIQNGTIAYCDLGVEMVGNQESTTNFLNPRVLDMVVTKCYHAGIYLQNAINPLVSDCRVSVIGGSTVQNRGFGMVIEGGYGGKAMNNMITDITGPDGGLAVGIEAENSNLVATGNSVSNVTAPNGSAYGLDNGAFALGNTIIACRIGISNYTKYSGNLTTGCATPFSGGTAVGTDNN